MPKNLLQDMIKIKNSEKERISKKIENVDFEKKFVPKKNIIVEQKSDSSKSSKYSIWFVAIICVVVLLFAFSFLFSAAKITIIPKIQNLELSDTFSAVKDQNSGELAFDLVVLQGEETKEIEAPTEKDFVNKAKGIVVVYNAFSTTSQNFAKNTRLEGSNGKIYKTDEKITVPGMTEDGTPGSIKVAISGAEAGEEYNSDPIDFKLFGLKGTEKYTKIYARSDGIISGGLKGKLHEISEADKTTAVTELKDTLQKKLFQKAKDQIPSGFILYPNAAFLITDDQNITATSLEEKVPVTLKGTFYGILFNEQKLTKKIIEKDIDNYKGEDIYIPDVRNLTFALGDKNSLLFNDLTSISFTLTGECKAVWRVDDKAILESVLGTKKKDFNQILTEYPNIDSAELVVKPVWRNTFPDKSSDIKIIINYPE